MSCGCWTDIASASCIVYSARALRGHKFCKFFKRTGPLFCNKSTMSGMARYYITPYRLKQISFLCDPERQTDRFVLLGITLLFSESKQGRAWVLDCRGIVDSVDQPACLLVHLKVTKQALHSHSLVLDSSAVVNQLWCRDQHCYRRDKSQSSQWPLSTFHRSQDLEDQVHPPRQTVWFGVA